MDTPVTNLVVDYSGYHRGCEHCGIILSQVPLGKVPIPCAICGSSHYCSPQCFLAEYNTRHLSQCHWNLDNEVDPSGAIILSSSQALWDLRKYTGRWREELGDAAVAALNLHANSSNIDKFAMVVYLSYVPGQWRRMARFRAQRAAAEPLSALTEPSMEAAKRKREEDSDRCRRSGMIGCVLIFMACSVPQVGFVYNATFIGPEAAILVHPPPPDWEARLLKALKSCQ